MRNIPRILVIDDDVENCQMLEAILRRDGYEIVASTDGTKAFEMAADLLPDLVMLDVKMPEVDGWQVSQQLYLAEATQDIPIIFVSGVVLDSEGIASALDRGANDFITKPFDSTEVRARVRACLRNKRLRDELVEKTRLLAVRATLDDLTGTFNRRLLYDRLRAELARAKRYQVPTTCLILEIDNLQALNDRYGPPIGDRIIQETATVLRTTMRVYDIISRYASDEFALVLPQAKADQGLRVAERIRKRIESHDYAADDVSTRITVSIGLATYPGDGEEVEDLLAAAESALAAAKKSGKNRSCSFGLEFMT
ncbi:MAG: diguanylate cyclase [Candidatus Sericytochromatia bacterium]|uniref:Diguanylate cyclase n=1 Tax=Candidatus Tanganyikabacteria bacterium TaxID=2961651 RepID=A0A937X858_9BACT|nr:diguanylate cyclase [Candidatus Tanganyikabacteria bacterium]